MASGRLSARSSRGVACLALTAAAALGGVTPAFPSSSPSPSPTAGTAPPESTQSPPLAGWSAGAGRQRPGRSPAELARQDALDERAEREEQSATTEPASVPAFTPDPRDFPEDAPAGRQALDEGTVRRVQQVSLGAGIALVGLGIGFLALRMRRAR
ncbi:hypothetical protein [Streptomyces sp. NPDC057509]|uniref:hypothetical protein n=1 Tax=Streptomyces sp. NPDC057509 TaxID=3346152 RepID=UPI0036C234B3